MNVEEFNCPECGGGVFGRPAVRVKRLPAVPMPARGMPVRVTGPSPGIHQDESVLACVSCGHLIDPAKVDEGELSKDEVLREIERLNSSSGDHFTETEHYVGHFVSKFNLRSQNVRDLLLAFVEVEGYLPELKLFIKGAFNVDLDQLEEEYQKKLIRSAVKKEIE